MSRYRVALSTVASAYIYVEADDEDAAIEAAFEETPYLCAQCSGWGNDSRSLELGDAWELDDEDAVALAGDES